MFKLCGFSRWSFNLSCVLVRLLADLSLTISLGCRLAWSICWKTPPGAGEKRRNLNPSLQFSFWTSCNKVKVDTIPLTSSVNWCLHQHILLIGSAIIHWQLIGPMIRFWIYIIFKYQVTYYWYELFFCTYDRYPVCRCARLRFCWFFHFPFIHRYFFVQVFLCMHLFWSGFPASSSNLRKAQPQLRSPLSPGD